MSDQKGKFWTYGWTDKCKDRQMDGQKDRQIRRWTERKNRYGNKRASGQIDRSTGGLTERWTDRQVV
jgi:hypothetical protein